MSDAGITKTAVIVEDDPQIRHILSETLEAAGFSTVSVGNGIDGVRAVLSYQPLITTLDVNMPGIDGFEAARRIRAQSDTYIIMLTGLEDEADVVLGLGAGADEYIVKPFRPRELRARIEALLRRPRATPPAAEAPAQAPSGPSFPGARPVAPAQPEPAASQPFAVIDGAGAAVGPAPAQPVAPPQPPTPAPTQPPAAAPGQPPAAEPPVYVPPQAYTPPPQGSAPAYRADPPGAGEPAPGSAVAMRSPQNQGASFGRATLVHRDLRLDPESHLVAVGSRDVELTRTEFELLATLMESKRRVRSKADLTLVLRGESYVTSYFVGDADKRAIEAHMTNLRRKIGDDPNNPRYIETVRGVGYRMTSEVAPQA
ncbi:hypothetical protein GCM10009808_26630 [Microbacterium sediminicola]|uniref:Two-component system response regulator n=1 Tax=Microbacterium sediminicola TaxID=415210 RepID=A0ABN2ILD8_9MICO